MNTILREKNRIQKREQRARAAFSLLLFAAFLVPVTFIVSPATSHSIRTSAIFNGYRLPLFGGFLFLCIAFLGITILGPSMQKTQRQKQNWLNEHGQHVLASVTRHQEKSAFVIGRSVRNSSSMMYLSWQDPQTAQIYTFYVNTRFSSALRNLPEGTLYPVHFDPEDPSFFVVPTQ